MRHKRVIHAVLEAKLYTTLANIKLDPTISKDKRSRRRIIRTTIKPLVLDYYPFPKYSLRDQNRMVEHLVEYYEVVIKELEN